MRNAERRGGKSGLVIVLAEDDPDLRAIYSAALACDGHEVHHAADGGAAIELVEQLSPDLLLLDLWMPILNGLEVLEALRAQPHLSLRTIVLTNHPEADARLEGFALGAEDSWTKNLSLDELRRRIRVFAEASAPDSQF